MKSISILNHESQVIYSEPTSNAVGFEEYFLKLLWFGGNIYKLLEKTLKKKIKVAFKLLIELSVEFNA